MTNGEINGRRITFAISIVIFLIATCCADGECFYKALMWMVGSAIAAYISVGWGTSGRDAYKISGMDKLKDVKDTKF